jgi:hypothetical protein
MPDTRRLLLSAALALTSALIWTCCGPKDPLAGVKQQYPDGQEYLTWQTTSPPRETYLLVRWKPDNLAGTQRAVLLVSQGSGWNLVGESQLGFLTLQEVSVVMGRPPDESTVQAFHLR